MELISQNKKSNAYEIIIYLLTVNITSEDVLDSLLFILGEPGKSYNFIFGISTGDVAQLRWHLH